MLFRIQAGPGHITLREFLLRAAVTPFAALVALVAMLLPSPGAAQQFAVDDAGITEQGACQLEGWWGEAEQFFLPACSFLPRTEVSLGAAHFDRGGGRTETHGILQAKWLAQDPEVLGWGWAIVVGTAVALERAPREASQVYAYVPVTRRVDAWALDLHANAGWVREQEVHGHHTHIHNGVWLGLRGDLAVATRLHLIGEVSGVVREPLEAQVGIRAAVLPDRLGLDLSYGFLPTISGPGRGWQIGMAWTPTPFRP